MIILVLKVIKTLAPPPAAHIFVYSCRESGFHALLPPLPKNPAYSPVYTVFGSTHVVERLSFSMFPSIPTFELDLILGSFLTFFGALIGGFGGCGRA